MMHVNAAMVLVNGFSGADMRDAPAPAGGAARRARPLDVSSQIRHPIRSEVRPQVRTQTRPELRPDIVQPDIVQPDIAQPDTARGVIARWFSALRAARGLGQERRHLALHIARLGECAPHLLDDIGVIARTGDRVEFATDAGSARP